MQRNRRTSIIVVGGALAIASIGYGLGSQADDGTAVAGSDRGAARGPAFEHGPPPGFGDLADTLGVEASRLEDALRDFHERKHADRRQDLAKKLAEALDVPVNRVTAALDAQEERLRKRFEARDGRPPHHGARHRALPLRQLSAALDVTPAELREAFGEIRPDRPRLETKWKQHQQELAEFLAERFDLEVEKVTDALGDLVRPAPHPHLGRPGPGGPGAFGPAR